MTSPNPRFRRLRAGAVAACLAVPLTAGCGLGGGSVTGVGGSASARPPSKPTASPLPTVTVSLGDSPSVSVVGARRVPGERVDVWGAAPLSALRAYAAQGDRAVARAHAAWPDPSPGRRRVALVVPASGQEFARVLGRVGADLSQVAAVTDGETDGTGRLRSPRVTINPVAFAGLTPTGREVVLTHEMTHAVVRSALPGRQELWLVEGFADHVGFAAAGTRRSALAAELLADVQHGRGPLHLPSEADLDPARNRIATGYLAAWTAVEMIAQRHGEATLRGFLRAATVPAAASESDLLAATDAAFGSVLGTSRAAFTKDWLESLRSGGALD